MDYSDLSTFGYHIGYGNYSYYVDHSLESNKLGISSTDHNKQILAFLDGYIDYGNYIIYGVNNLLGIIDKEFNILLPPVFERLFPVKLINTEDFLNNQIPLSANFNILNGNWNNPEFFLVQKDEESFCKDLGLIFYDYVFWVWEDFNSFSEEEIESIPKSRIYKVIQDFYEEQSDIFIGIFKNTITYINLKEGKVEGTRGKNILKLCHYRDNLFFCRDENEKYGYGSFHYGYFFIDAMWGEASKSIPFKKDPSEFISMFFYNEDFVTINNNGKWSLNKYRQKDGQSFLSEIIPFELDTPLRQTNNHNRFLCHAYDKEFLVEYDELYEISEYKNDVQNEGDALSEYKRKCFKNKLKIISPDFVKLMWRDDDLYNVFEKSGWGLLDNSFKVLIPSIYDQPIENYGPIIKVIKNHKVGAVDSHGNEIIPCKYNYIIVDSKKISFLKEESIIDDDTGEEECWSHLYNYIAPYGTDTDLDKLGVIALGLTVTLDSEGYEEDSAICDVYQPNGDFILSSPILLSGGIEYINKKNLIIFYGRLQIDINGRPFYSNVKYYFIKEQKSTPYFNQVSSNDDETFMIATDNGVGVALIDNGIMTWLIPCTYHRILFSINDLYFALKWCEQSVCIDIYDSLHQFSKVLTKEIQSDSSLYDIYSVLTNLKNDPILSEIDRKHIERLTINYDDLDKGVLFPFEEIHLEEEIPQRDNEYPIEDSWRDAFEDDPEAIWGILD